MIGRRVAALLAASALPMVGLGLLPVSTGSTAAHAATQIACDEGVLPDTELTAGSKARTNPAFERMHVPLAQEITDGSGVSVAVIDSGIRPGLGMNVVRAVSLPGLKPELLSGHGSLVGGLIAGPDGVAPGAQLVDIRVFDSAAADVSQGEKAVTSQGITDGIRQAIALHASTRFKVVNIALSVESDDPNLRQAIKDLLKLDVVVVASAGNASETAAGDDFEGTPDNDAEIYPADYPGVLAVSAAPPPGETPLGSIVPNADTDLAAPTLGAISVNANGQRCDMVQVATSWAAAEVSGVAALLRARYPGDTAKQTVARMMATTEGSKDAPNPWLGAGVVQANDALTRALDPGRSGKMERSVQQNRLDSVPPPPPPRIDLFGSSRALLLWFGLAAGALMALAFMLRSLVRR